MWGLFEDHGWERRVRSSRAIGVVTAKGFLSEPEAQPSSVLLDKGQGVC